MGHRFSRTHGFTIVELLIVIVVIAILATITIVAYNGVSNNALRSAQIADLSQLSKRLESYKLIQSTAEQYPASLAALSVDSDTSYTLNYSYNAAANSYCLSAEDDTVSHYITSSIQQPKEGSCVTIDGLIGWWQMNGSPADTSGFNTSGTLSGPVPAVGQNGDDSGSYLFSGATTQFINTNGRYAADRFTVSLWAYYDGTGPSSFASLISNTRDCCTTNRGFQIDFARTDPQQIRARLWAGGTGPASVAAGGGVPVNQWTHIAMTYDGLNVRLYQNGLQVASSAITLASLGTPLYNVSIGKMGENATAYSFGGRMDDTRIYNRALSASDILLIYENGAL